MEILHVIFTNFEHIRNAMLAIPERKLMPIAAFTPIIIGLVIFGWQMMKWKLSSYNEQN